MLKPNDEPQSAVLNFGAWLFSHDYSFAFCCRMGRGSEVFQKMAGKKNIDWNTALWYRGLPCQIYRADAQKAVGSERKSNCLSVLARHKFGQ